MTILNAIINSNTTIEDIKELSKKWSHKLQELNIEEDILILEKLFCDSKKREDNFYHENRKEGQNIATSQLRQLVTSCDIVTKKW